MASSSTGTTSRMCLDEAVAQPLVDGASCARRWPPPASPWASPCRDPASRGSRRRSAVAGLTPPPTAVHRWSSRRARRAVSRPGDRARSDTCPPWPASRSTTMVIPSLACRPAVRWSSRARRRCTGQGRPLVRGRPRGRPGGRCRGRWSRRSCPCGARFGPVSTRGLAPRRRRLGITDERLTASRTRPPRAPPAWCRPSRRSGVPHAVGDLLVERLPAVGVRPEVDRTFRPSRLAGRSREPGRTTPPRRHRPAARNASATSTPRPREVAAASTAARTAVPTPCAALGLGHVRPRGRPVAEVVGERHCLTETRAVQRGRPSMGRDEDEVPVRVPVGVGPPGQLHVA